MSFVHKNMRSGTNRKWCRYAMPYIAAYGRPRSGINVYPLVDHHEWRELYVSPPSQTEGNVSSSFVPKDSCVSFENDGHPKHANLQSYLFREKTCRHSHLVGNGRPSYFVFQNHTTKVVVKRLLKPSFPVIRIKLRIHLEKRVLRKNQGNPRIFP